MSYTPTEWKSGDIVTSEKLNKLEQGVASSGSDSGILIVTVDTTTMTFDKTWKQIHDSSFVGVYMTSPHSSTSKLFTFVLDASGDNQVYLVRIFNPDNVGVPIGFTTDSEDGYPVMESN